MNNTSIAAKKNKVLNLLTCNGQENEKVEQL